MNLDKKAVVELVKSFARFVWFGFLGLVGTWLTSLVAGGSLANAHVTLFGSALNVGFLLTLGIGFVIKAIDRYVHKSKNTDVKGLAPGFLQS